GLGLEFERGDNGAGIDLYHRAEHVKLLELALDAGGDVLELLLIVRIASRRLVQQVGGWKRVDRMKNRLRRRSRRGCRGPLFFGWRCGLQLLDRANGDLLDDGKIGGRGLLIRSRSLPWRSVDRRIGLDQHGGRLLACTALDGLRLLRGGS